MEDEKITKFMKETKSFFEPISNLINFQAIEDYLYADTVGDIEEEDLTIDYIFTLVDFMLDSQQKTKEEALKFYRTTREYEEERLKEAKILESILDKRMHKLEEGEKNERFANI
ncbi:MAG: hypothetical protein HFJ27_01695 [Clostridia bacterium]|nr:hypothetical protein [Clostridia bacterium]